MKVIFVDQRHGHTRTIVLKGWLKGLLSLCILGAPVAFGYLGYQVAVSGNGQQYTLTSAAVQSGEADTRTETRKPSSFQQEAATYTYTPHQFLQDNEELVTHVVDRAQQRNGYIARFEHSDKFLASAGDVIRQGHLIELAGDSRSPGPNLSFAIYRNGRVVDPASYLQRTER